MPKDKNRQQIGPMFARAAFVPDSFNEEDRTVEVVFGTDAPVRMWDWEKGGSFMESMSFDEGHVRWDRLNGGAPVLDNHNSYNGTEGVLGVVEKAWADKKEGRAVLRFDSENKGAEAFRKVKEGLLSGISFGYRVYKYEEQTSEEGELPKYKATDWEAFEISLAPIQADAGAGIRKTDKELGSVEIIPLSLSQNQRSNEDITIMTEDEKIEKARAEAAALEVRKQEKATAEKEAKEAIVASERKRASEINGLCRKFNVSEEDQEAYVSGSDSIEAVRKAITDNWTTEDPNKGQRSAGSTKVTGDERDTFRAKAEESILLRVKPDTKVENGGDEFRGLNLIDLARECVTLSGESTRGLSRRETAERAMATSDFPIILGNAVNRSLRDEYDLATRTFTDWASKGTAKDFRSMERSQLSGLVSSFKEVQEGGEYEQGTMTEGKETYAVAKYGQIIPLTWESIINDDLNAFSRIPKAIANKAAQKQSDIVYAILTANAAMEDGTALFHADHGNLGTGGVISDTTLTEMRKQFRQQTDMSNDFLNLMPSFLICGPDTEAAALKYMNMAFSPATVGNTNIHQGTMKVVTEGRLTGAPWYAAASPGAVDTVEYSFLEGEGELFTEQKQGFDVDGVQIKARMVFGAKAIDHRGLWKNAGA